MGDNHPAIPQANIALFSVANICLFRNARSQHSGYKGTSLFNNDLYCIYIFLFAWDIPVRTGKSIDMGSGSVSKGLQLVHRFCLDSRQCHKYKSLWDEQAFLFLSTWTLTGGFITQNIFHTTGGYHTQRGSEWNYYFFLWKKCQLFINGPLLTMTLSTRG